MRTPRSLPTFECWDAKDASVYLCRAIDSHAAAVTFRRKHGGTGIVHVRDASGRIHKFDLL